LNTSYFSSKKILQKDLNLVSICRKVPTWFNVPCKSYKPLQPSWDLVMSYRSGKITKQEYTNQYYDEFLNRLDPARTYQELGEDAILLCYEAPLEFCHRHIVAKWLMDNLGIIIMEL
jgi:hypothetical protein